MDIAKLRTDFRRLTNTDSIASSIDVLNIFSDYFFKVAVNHHNDPVSTAERDAVILNQMMLSKVMHIKKLVEGVGFQSTNGMKLNPIIDPTIIASLVRNIYETVSAFNLIYISPKTSDEKSIIYFLWVISGLKYRQRFESIAKQQISLQRLQEEKEQIEILSNNIKEIELYKNLSVEYQDKIKKLIKDKEYRILFDGYSFKTLSWQELCSTLGIKENLFQNMYTYFSLYSHPSNVSVFQFSEMFRQETEEFKRITVTILKSCFMLLGSFSADYLRLFPKASATFNSLDVLHQIIINFYNSFARGQEYSINDKWKIMG